MSDTTTHTEPGHTEPAYKELHRSRDERMIAGVAGGLGRYFDLNPALFRVGFVVLALLGGSGLFIYGAAALVIPDEGRRDSIASEALRERREHPWQLIGLGLVVVAGAILLSHVAFWPDASGLWLLVLAAGALILWSQRRGREPQLESQLAGREDAPATTVPPRRKPYSVALPVLGALAAAAGLLGVVQSAGHDVRWDLALAVAAIVAGLAAVAGAIFRLRIVGVTILAVLLAIAAAIATSFNISFEGPIGDTSYHPRSTTTLRDEYHASVGDLHVNLADVSLTARTKVEATVGIGDLRIVVPPHTRVRVDGSVSAGHALILGREFHGSHVDETVVSGSGRTLVVDAHVGIGELRVTRAAVR